MRSVIRTLGLISGFCMAAYPHGFAQEIRISAGLEIRPYGAAVSELVARAGLQPATEFFPGERSLQMLENGKVDAELFRTAAAVAAFAGKVSLVGPIGCSELAAFKRASDPLSITGVQDLQKVRVAIPLISRFLMAFAEENDIRFEKVMTTDNLYNMLDRGRFDIALSPSTLALQSIRHLGLEGKIVQTGPVLRAEPLYLVLRNERKEWGPRIQAEIDKAVASGAWHETVGTINKSVALPVYSGLSCLKKKR